MKHTKHPKPSKYVNTVDLLNSFEKRKKSFYERQKILESQNYKQLIYRIANKNNCNVIESTSNTIFGKETVFAIKVQDTDLTLVFNSKDLKTSDSFITAFNNQIKKYKDEQATKLATLLNLGYTENDPLVRTKLNKYKDTIRKCKNLKKEYKYFIKHWNESNASAYSKANALLTAQENSLIQHQSKQPKKSKSKIKQKTLTKRKIKNKIKERTKQKQLVPQKVNTITHTRKLTEEEMKELLKQQGIHVK